MRVFPARPSKLDLRQRDIFRPLVGLCCLWFGVVGVGAQTGSRARGAILPIYLDREPTPAAVVRVDEIYTQYQRRGFFRIGLLPQLVAKGVTLELGQTAQMTNALRTFRPQLFAVHGSDPFLCCGIKVRRQNDSRLLLQAQSLKFNDQGQWELTDGNLHGLHFDRATLQPTGPSAGRVVCQTEHQTSARNLFEPTANPPDPGNRNPP